MDENRLDDILYQACKESRESLLAFGPDFSNIEKEALLKLRKRKTARRRRVWVRAAATVAAVFLFINLFFIFADFEPVKAYRAQVRMLFFNLVGNESAGSIEAEIVRTSNEISRAQKTVPYHIPVPGWIPDGYKFDDVRVINNGNDVCQVTIEYKDGNDIIHITIDNDAWLSKTFPSTEEGSLERLTIDDSDIYAAFIQRGDKYRTQCHYYNKQGLHVFIAGDFDKQSLTKFIQALK